MSERTFDSYTEAAQLAFLVKKMCGQDVVVVPWGRRWVVRPEPARKTIVEVTEALLRQVGK